MSRYPFPTQVVSAGLLAATGDAFCQLCVQRNPKYDFARTARFFCATVFVVAPLQTRWFPFLERNIVARRPKISPLKRVVVDQIFGAPFFNTTFLFTLALLEHRSVRTATHTARHQIGHVLVANYKLWPFVQLFNFYLVPLHYRIILLQFVGIFWNAYISYATQNRMLA
uniref:Mitochondrial inner membrane protein Mpv17 n=1 Tax=Steinernema glaseri TaxID=37863 RepID=A0A1I8A7V7_9BILA